MRRYGLLMVDAFTSVPFGGNPAGVVLDAEGLSEEEMQAIAREVNAAETAFVTPSEKADFRVRFFTPRQEIPLAGHPTIATMHALAEAGRIDLSHGARRVTQELSIGILPVDLERLEDGRTRVIMTQAPPDFGHTLDPAPLAAALRIEPGEIVAQPAPQIVSTGTPQAMVMVRSRRVLGRIQPDYARLAVVERECDYFSTHVFALDPIDPANRTHARHFGANPGFNEDPVTGSATGAMAAYLWRYGLMRERAYSCEQGHFAGRPGIVDVELDAEGDTPTTVRIAGTAVTVLTGTLRF